jgi:hypothetical protein
VYWNDHAAAEPHARIRREVKRLVGDAHVHRLVGGEAGATQRIAHRAGCGEEITKAYPWKGLARGKALRSLSEQRSEIQARREIEKVGGWRNDCATTQ